MAFLGSKGVTFVMFLVCVSSMATMDEYVGLLKGRRMHMHRSYDNCHMVFDRAGMGRPCDIPRVVCF